MPDSAHPSCFDEDDVDLDIDIDIDIESWDIELHKIPRRLWQQTLAPLTRQERYWIAQQVPDQRLRETATTLVMDLFAADDERATTRDNARGRALRAGAPLPTPGTGHAVKDPRVQLNIRMRTDDRARLTEAARAVGLSPTTLARALILNGAAQLLREHANSGDGTT